MRKRHGSATYCKCNLVYFEKSIEVIMVGFKIGWHVSLPTPQLCSLCWFELATGQLVGRIP
ncbi:hypothetical protein ES702_06326 [subsurface metagenome]